MAVQTNQSSRPFFRERPSVLAVRDAPEPALGTHEVGIYGYIAKPFDAKDVANRIAQALCGRCLGGEAALDEEALLWQQRHEFTHASSTTESPTRCLRIIRTETHDDEHLDHRRRSKHPESLARRAEAKGVRGISGGQRTNGIDMLERTRPLITILDLHLLDLNGLEVLSRLRAIDPEACVIMLTGVGTKEVETKALTLGAADFLKKGFSLFELGEAVRRAMA